MKTALADFISAGFLVTRKIDRPSHASADLLPERIVSASGCLAPFVPDTWCIQWTHDPEERRVEKARVFGLDHHSLNKITVWATQRFGKAIKWPNVIVNLSTAQALVDLFLGTTPGIQVLELALHRSMQAVLCRAADPAPPESGYAATGRQGVHDLILQEQSPAHGGRVLGFEPLVFNYSLSCSWLCNSLDTVVARSLGIRPNSHGLIGTFAEARDCVEYISLEDVGAEPGLWLPWLIIDHTQSVRHATVADSKEEHGGVEIL